MTADPRRRWRELGVGGRLQDLGRAGFPDAAFARRPAGDGASGVGPYPAIFQNAIARRLDDDAASR